MHSIPLDYSCSALDQYLAKQHIYLNIYPLSVQQPLSDLQVCLGENASDLQSVLLTLGEVSGPSVTSQKSWI